jgi:hypothetical protein
MIRKIQKRLFNYAVAGKTISSFILCLLVSEMLDLIHVINPCHPKYIHCTFFVSMDLTHYSIGAVPTEIMISK